MSGLDPWPLWRKGDLLTDQANSTTDAEQRARLRRRSVAAYEAALRRIDDPRQELTIRLSIARNLALLGDRDANAAVLERILALASARSLRLRAYRHVEIGRALAASHRPTEADRSFARAERVFRRAKSCVRADQVVERVQWSLSDVLNARAWTLAEAGWQTDFACQLADEAMELTDDPERLAMMLDTRGWARLHRRDTAGAVKDLERATELQPTPERLLHLALALHACSPPSDLRRVPELIDRAEWMGITGFGAEKVLDLLRRARSVAAG
jgi:hypothetical protein